MTVSLLDKLIAEARRIEEDTEYSSKGHYNAADRWGRYHLCIGLPVAVLAAIAGGLAILTAALTTVLTFLKPSD